MTQYNDSHTSRAGIILTVTLNTTVGRPPRRNLSVRAAGVTNRPCCVAARVRLPSLAFRISRCSGRCPIFLYPKIDPSTHSLPALPSVLGHFDPIVIIDPGLGNVLLSDLEWTSRYSKNLKRVSLMFIQLGLTRQKWRHLWSTVYSLYRSISYRRSHFSRTKVCNNHVNCYADPLESSSVRLFLQQLSMASGSPSDTPPSRLPIRHDNP